MHTRSTIKGFILFALFAIFTASAIANSPQCLVSFDSAKLDVCEDRISLVNEDLRHLADIRAFADSGMRIVKFDAPITAQQRSALAALNVQILGYAPFYGYKVRMDAALDVAVRDIPGVNWTGPYLPVWKVGINLTNELLDGRILNQAVDLDGLLVSLHPGVPASQARGVLDAIPGATFRFDGKDFDHEFVVLGFDRDQLSSIVDEIAVNEDVNVVSFHWPAEFMNSQGVGLHQSGVASPPEVPVFDQGLYGCGQIIGILDSGLHTAHCSFDEPGVSFPFDNCGQGENCNSIPATDDHRKIAAYYKWSGLAGGPGDDHNGGGASRGHGTFVAGNAVGSNLANPVNCDNPTSPGNMEDVDGMAPGARMVMQEAGGSLQYLNDLGGSLYHAATTAYENGARIHNNSWGSGCRGLFGCVAGCIVEYRPHSRGGDAAVWDFPELLIVAAAGNSGGGDGGPGCGPGADVGAPGNAKSVFGIGGTQRGTLGDNMYVSSSRGPASDRRTKPDVLAQSTGLFSSTKTTCGTDSWAGTSFGSPTAAGLGALVREYLQRGFYPLGVEDPGSAIPNPSAALIRAIMINGSVEMTGTGVSGDFPDQNQGWGRTHLDNGLYFAGDDRQLWLHDEVVGLETGDVDVHPVVALDGQPLVVTLVWHDFPAEVNADPHIVNMLRLEVEAPNGDVWTQKLPPGGGLTNPNPFQATTLDDHDDRNTVHQIMFDEPAAGTYLVRVRGIQVAMGDMQPYALAITGDLGGFSIDPPSAQLCIAEGSVDFTLTLSAQYEGTTNLSVTGEPAGTSGAFNPNPIVFPDDESVYTLSGLAGTSGGDYTLEFTATDSVDTDITATVGVGLVLYEDSTGPIMLLTPADEATNIDLRPEFGWEEMTGAAEYHIQVATDPGFGALVIDQTVSGTSFTPSSDLATGTDFFWRVRGLNACGDGDWSLVFEFQTRFEPVADISPTNFDINVQVGDTASDILFIENTGTGELAWQIGTDEISGDCTAPTAVPWLSASPDSGNTPPGPPAEPDIIVDGNLLTHGQHEANLCVTTNTTSGPQLVVIPVFVNAIDPSIAFLEGNVESLGLCGTDGEPLGGALVSVQGQDNLFEQPTDGDGFYSFEISEDESPVTITVSADLHATEVRSNVVLTGGQLNIEDFDLAGDTGCIEVDPTEFAVALELGQTQNETLQISNVGTQALNWMIVLPDERGIGRSGYVALEVPDDEPPPFHSVEQDNEAGFERLDWTANPGTPAITGAARNQLLRDGVLLVPNTGSNRIIALDPETGDLLDPDFVVIDQIGTGAKRHALLHPDGERILLSHQTQHVIHAFDSDGEYLGIFAPADGQDTAIMQNIRGMAFHPDTGNLLVTSASGGNNNTVVEFDLEGNFLGVFVASGSGGISSPWSIVFRDQDFLLGDGTGDDIHAFSHDGATHLGVWNDTTMNFIQQITEIDNGNVLAATFSSPSGVWEFDPDGDFIERHEQFGSLSGVHELPGGTILVSNSAGVHEIDRDGNVIRTIISGSSHMIQFVQSLDCSAPGWVSFDVESGSIPPAGSPDLVTVTFDPDGLAPGVYEGNFCVESNDPVEPLYQVPVTLTVDLPANFATLEGTVQTAGFCSAGELVPLEGAAVEIAGALDTYQLTTDANGFYQIFLPDDESPVDITVTAPDHLTQMATGETFIGGDVVVNDFDMEGDSACIDIDPEAVSATLPTGDTTDETLDISNFGSQTLNWEITTNAIRGGSDPLIGFTLKTATSSGPDPQNWTRISTSSGMLSNVQDDTGTATDVDFEWGIVSGSMSFIAEGTVAADAVPQFGYDLTGMNGYGFGSAGRYFFEFSDLSPNAPYEIWLVGYRNTLGIEQTVEISDGDDLAAIEFDQVITSGANNGRFIVNDVVADDSMHWDDLSVVTNSSSSGTIRIEVERFAQSTSVGAVAIRPAVDCELPDWITNITPTSGSIGSGGSPETVTVSLDADGLPPDLYTDAFCITSNDPVRSEFFVPVTMEVTQSADVATVQGTVESAGFCDAGELMPLEGASVEIVGQTDTFLATTNENGFYEVLMDVNESPVDITVTAADHLEETVIGVALIGAGVVVQDFVLGGDSACIDVDPEELFENLEVGQTSDQFVDISNVGSQTLNWNLFEPSVRASSDARVSHDGASEMAAVRGISDPLIGLTFKTSGSTSDDPQNWTRVSSNGGLLDNVQDDTGAATDVSFEWGVLSGSMGFIATGILATDAVPQYEYDLAGMNGYGFGSNSHYFFEFSGLTPGSSYEVWFTGFRSGSAIDQQVWISDGDTVDAIQFVQSITSGDNNGRFYINDVIADDTMDFNDLALITSSSSSGTIRIEVESITQSAVVGAIALRQALSCELPEWLSVAPPAGSIDPEDPADMVTVSFDADQLAPGTHEGAFCVESNDPTRPVVLVPVTLDVTLPANFATIEGTVESLGYCDASPAPLAGATVEIAGAVDTYIATTDENGFYQVFLPDDDSPADITVSAPGHLDDGVTNVTFVGGNVVVEDFELLLNAPCATHDPNEHLFEVPSGGTETQTLTIGNIDGNAALEWDTLEPVGGLLLHDNGPLITHPGAGPGGSDHSTLQNSTLSMNILGFFMAQSGDGPHNRTADEFEVDTQWTVETITFYGYQTGSPTSPSTFTEVNYQIWDGPPDDPASSVVFGDTTTNRMQSTEWTGIYRVSETTVGTTRPIMAIVAEGGFTLDPGTYWVDFQLEGSGASGPFGPPVTILGEDTTGNALQLLSDGWIPVIDTDGSETPQGFPFLITGGGICWDPADVDWLDVVPTSGNIAAGGDFAVDVIVDADGLTQGDYTTTLCISTNDAMNPVMLVPVSLVVTDPDAGTLDGTVTSAGYCGTDPHPVEGAIVTAVGSANTFDTTTDENGFYQIHGINQGESPLEVTVAAGGYQDGLETGVLISAQQTTTVDFDLVLDAPCATADPDSIETELIQDTTGSETLTIGNEAGGADLMWTIETALVPDTAGRIAYDYSVVGFDGDIASRTVSGQLSRAGSVDDIVMVFDGNIVPEPQGGPIADDFEEGFEDITLLPGAGWAMINNSTSPGSLPNWVQGSTSFDAHAGPANSLIGSSFNAVAGSGDLSHWLITPEIVLQNGTELRFWTRTTAQFQDFNDRLEVRLSTAGSSTDVGTTPESVGDFDELMLTINPDLLPSVYPEVWTEFVITLEGLGAPTSGRFAFRHWVPNSGPAGSNGDFVAIDTFSITQPEDGCAAPEDVAWLSVDPDSGTTLAGGTTGVTVNFNAAGLDTGDYEALLCLNSNDPFNPQIEVPVVMTVVEQAPAELGVDPDTLDFGDVVISTSAMMTFDVHNEAEAGAANLTLTAIDADGDAEFAVTGGSCMVGSVIEPGDSCTVEVTFEPSAVAAFSGDVTVEGDGQMAVVTLAGMGVEPDPGELELSPSSLDFGNVAPGTTVTDELTLTNIGEETAPVLVSTITVSSNPAGVFIDTGNGSCEAGVTELEPGASCTIEVAFTPADETSYSAIVVVNGSDGKLTLASLSGNGVEPTDDIFADRFEE